MNFDTSVMPSGDLGRGGTIGQWAARGEPVSFGGLETGIKEPDQLFSLAKNESKLAIPVQPAFSLDEPCPALCFPEFFQTHLHFVDEVFCRFWRLCLAMIAIRRSPRAQ